jgi:hypothetical protein
MSETQRDADIRAAVERRRVDDTKILQKVNAAHRDAFHQRFPGAIIHNMRLINERLQHALSKSETVNLYDTTTWPATPSEIAELCAALWYLEQTRQHWLEE